MAKLQDPRVLGGCVYYAQNREDLVLLSFFAGEKDGFYVDIGGFDPDLDSVTKMFYLRGWRGINVEPQPDRFKLFQKRRKRDINLNVGVSDKASKLKLRIYQSGGLSTFSNSLKENYEKQPDQDTGKYRDITVPVVTLKKIFIDNQVERISFLKVDVEGLEYEVLSGNDWEKYRPEVLCIEANHVENDWHPLLRKAEYELVFNDGLNDYYADSRTDRAKKFDFVKEVVHDRGGGIRADHYQLLLDWFNYGSDKGNHVEALAAENERLHQKISAQEAEWSNPAMLVKRLAYLAKSRGGKGNRRG